jgi:mannose-1-phosphate guanylyltransferase/mannose-6-phosphate isomerase
MARPIIPAIMCGGSGTRLWPLSRETMPKQFVTLADGRSTFQASLARVAGVSGFGAPLVLAHQDFRFIVAEQMQAAGVSGEIVLEPKRRDSAAAVAVAALAASARDAQAVVLVMAADHVIPDVGAFVQACRIAAEAAEAGSIMTLGVRPTEPATGYGYIRSGASIGGAGARRVEAFVEKPDRATAERHVAAGYLWNSGNFLFRADVMLAELEVHAPKVLSAARQAFETAQRDLDFLRLEASAFAQAPKISIDYAVMEKTARAGVLPVDFAWSDVGTWGALWEVAADRDAAGNVARGDIVLARTRNSIVHSEGLLTAVVGLDDVVVVTTPDAVLVTHRGEADGIKALVSGLRAAGRSEADQHLRVHRPWGWYQRIDIGTRFQVKRIMVKPGGRLSLQKHHHRAEHWIVVHGTAEVTVDAQVKLVHENEGIHIPIGALHRLYNPGKIALELIEVQVGSYTGEDDIVRIEDDYRRS